MRTKLVSFSILLFLIFPPLKAQTWEFVGLDSLIIKQLYVSVDTIWASADYIVENQIRSNLYFTSNCGNSWAQLDSA